MTVLPACANCGTALNGPYCSNCGQKASDYHRPFWWIFGEFLDSVFGYDSRTFRTIWLLFAEPGEFTRRYNAGQRASLLPPFRLFLIATVVFFVSLQLTGLAMVAFKTRTVPVASLPQEAVEAIKKGDNNARVTIEAEGKVSVVTIELFVPVHPGDHKPISEDQKRGVDEVRRAFDADTKNATPDEAGWLKWMEAKGKRIAEGYERALTDPLKLNGPLNVWLPRLMLVLVPIFALLLALVHWWPRVYLIEHLVFSIHIHTVVFVALSLVTLAAAALGNTDFLWAVWLLLIIYLWMAVYRVYGRSWWLTTLKVAGVLVVYSVVLMAGLGVIFLLALSEV
ncbi:MAG: DUF3667 domain-containing protein [Alphaproteobacteria bacterium]|jgi:hypothetical protein|nr:DUF3667 domain-containing protein [Alphaproteobacteria bacterium]